jgi:RNA polymerase sigma-70 factor (ECF subfamily)
MISERRRGTARQLAFGELPERAQERPLLEGVCAGEVASLQLLIDEHWRPLLGYATRIIDDRDSAEDIVQETFIRLWERRSDWDPRASARVILYTIVRNLALNGRKSAKVRDRWDVQRRVLRPSPIPAPDDALEADELTLALQEAIEALPPRRREILLLSRYDSLSRSEIAELLSLSPQTVANHLALAISDLRERLRLTLASG